MIIGSAEALGQLGAQLQTAGTAAANTRLPDWPPVIASPTVFGPYVNEPDFKLSFHVLRTSEVPRSLPLCRRGLPIWLSLAFGVLTLIGAAAVAMWALR